MYSERGKFDVYDDLDGYLQALTSLDVSLVYATRKVDFKSQPGTEPLTAVALYVVACHRSQELTEFVSSKSMRLG